jgi:spore germination cell wall hydrolase CwlJ-like protein
MLWRWTWALRRRWHQSSKGPLIFICLFGGVMSALGLLVYSVYSYEDDRQALTCLALNIYFEARGEPLAGQYAVAEVTMNRLAARRYPKTVCGVVHQKNWDSLRGRYVGAFSWTELDEKPSLRSKEWRRAVEVADAVYYARHTPALKGALHYHASYIEPSWSKGQAPVARIGRHIFYK